MRKIRMMTVGIVAATLAVSACQRQDVPASAPATSGAAQSEGAVAEAGGTASETAGIRLVSATLPEGELTNSATVKCNIEYVAGQLMESDRPQIAKAASVRISGWYHDSANPAAVTRLYIREIGNAQRVYSADMGQRTERPDVSAATGGVTSNVGFDVNVDVTNLDNGDYGVFLANPSLAPTSLCGVGRGFSLH